MGVPGLTLAPPLITGTDMKTSIKRRQQMKEYREANKDAIRKRQTAWAKDNPDRVASHQRKTKYGVTEEMYTELVTKNKHQCQICNNETKLVVDHCHDTGTIRGVLCRACNLALGHFKDDINRLTNALKYIKSTSA